MTRLDPEAKAPGVTRMLISTALLLIALVAGYVSWVGLPARGDTGGYPVESGSVDPDPAAAAAAQSFRAQPAMPVPVATARARRGDLVMKITATGTAEATRLLEVQSAANVGTIVEIAARDGDVVEAGAALVRIDDTDLRLEVQKVREGLIAAIAKFSEGRLFFEAGDDASEEIRELGDAQDQLFAGLFSPEHFRSLISDPRFDELFSTITRDEIIAAQDSLMTRRAAYRQAELELERATTRAPFGGQVAELKAVVGQRVTAGTTLLTLVDADPIRVQVEVLESEAGLVRHGRRAEVRFAAFPGEVFSGRVESISPLVDPEKRSLGVTVTLPNPELRLKPGMFAQITLDTQIFTDRLIVPAEAVLLRDERPMLFVVQDSRSSWIYIKKGLENAEWVEVLDGVAAGDEVIVSGHFSLAHDAVVRVIEETEADSTAERD